MKAQDFILNNTTIDGMDFVENESVSLDFTVDMMEAYANAKVEEKLKSFAKELEDSYDNQPYLELLNEYLQK